MEPSSRYYPPNELDATRTTLLNRVGKAETDAWQTLVQVYGPVVRYWILKEGVDRADVSDVFQEVFMAVHRNMPGFQREPGAGKFRAWLKSITLSKVIDSFRRRGRQPRAAGGTAAFEQMHQVVDGRSFESPANAQGESAVEPANRSHTEGDDTDCMEEALLNWQVMQSVKRQFQPQSWQAFWRTAIDGCPAPDVAAELGISSIAVRKAKSRVLCKLREALSNEQLTKGHVTTDDASQVSS